VKHQAWEWNGLGATFQQLGTHTTMRVGQTAYVCVAADNLWNDSGINVVSGQAFTFSVPSGEQWIDWRTPCGADGYPSTRLIRFWEKFRRIPNANWMQLIATIGKSIERPIVVGSKLMNFLPPLAGRLYLFANDLHWMYWNNKGTMAVRITRTK
jgi:hypothetical protein